MIPCILTLIGSFIVIYFILAKGLFAAMSFKILLYLSVNDSIRSIARIIELFLGDSDTLCIVISFLYNFVLVSNMFWALSLSVTIYQIIVLELTDFEKYHKWWFLISYILIGIIEALPISTQSFKYSQGICEISLDMVGSIWRFTALFIPSTVAMITIFCLFGKIYKKLKIIGNFSIKILIFDRGFIYVGIVALLFIPLLVMRIIQFFVNHCITDLLIEIVYMIGALQGMLNAMAFFYNKTVQKFWKQKKSQEDSIAGKVINRESIVESLRISFASDIN